MRTVTYGAACSMDGFITAADGAIDWLHFSRDVEDVMRDYWKGVDAILMGRKTWEFATRSGGGGGAGSSTIATYVFSRSLANVPGATLVREDAGEFVRQLKSRPGKGICVLGGGELAVSLIDAGVVDEISLNVHPVLLGHGTAFLPGVASRVQLQLNGCRELDGGCVLLTYGVRH